jgi:hypothetical protein
VVKSMLLAVAMFLTASALPKMTKPGMSNEQFARDNYDCYRDSLPPRPSYVWPNQQETDRRLYQMCIEARGYSRD